jgi:hypothetical protein
MQTLTSAHPVVYRPAAAAQRSQDLTPTREQFEAWLRYAAAGARLVYHRGYLAVDRARGSGPLSESARRELVVVANLALALAEQGKIHLVQQRTGPDTFSYIAVKAHPDRPVGRSG